MMAEIETVKSSESVVSENVSEVAEQPKRRGRPPKSATPAVADANTCVITEPNIPVSSSNDTANDGSDSDSSVESNADSTDPAYDLNAEVSGAEDGSDLTTLSSSENCVEDSVVDYTDAGVECVYAPVCNAIRKQIRCGSWYYRSPNANCAIGQMPCKCACSVIEYIGKFVKVRAHIPNTGLRTIYVYRDDII